MSILGIDTKHPGWKLRKTMMVYLILSLTAIAVDHIYALFGHGVRSQFMSLMFLYPLAAGTGLYLLLELLAPQVSRASGYRLFTNLYNSGIATLTTASFLQGILEIAGTSSPYTVAFYAAGGAMAAAGLILLMTKSLHLMEKE